MSYVKTKYKYFVGTRDQFDKLVSLNKILDSYIVFISDTHELYKGLDKYGSDNFIIATKKPAIAYENILYCINGALMVYNKVDGWIEVSKPHSLYIDEESNDDTVPTSRAVFNAIKESIENAHFVDNNSVVGVTCTKLGTITVTKNSGRNTDVPIFGAVVDPSYDPVNRIITLPIVGDSEPLKISLGKDVHIQSGFYNKLNKTLQFSRSDGEVINVDLSDAASSVNLKSVETETLSLVINGDQISGNVKVSKKRDNIIEIEQDGLYAAAAASSGNAVIEF